MLTSRPRTIPYRWRVRYTGVRPKGINFRRCQDHRGTGFVCQRWLRRSNLSGAWPVPTRRAGILRALQQTIGEGFIPTSIGFVPYGRRSG